MQHQENYRPRRPSGVGETKVVFMQLFAFKITAAKLNYSSWKRKTKEKFLNGSCGVLQTNFQFATKLPPDQRCHGYLHMPLAAVAKYCFDQKSTWDRSREMGARFVFPQCPTQLGCLLFPAPFPIQIIACP